MAQMRAAHRRAVECLDLALPHLDPPGERVLIPYQGKHLAATLRKPRNVPRPPVVLMTMGLDSTKEELLTFEDTFLARGMAILAFDGPGQGEAEYDFPIRPDYEAVTATVIDWVESNRDDLDATRIGSWGISLGGYYAPRSAAFETRIKACIANCGPWNFGALWDKLPVLTRLAFIARSHSNSDEEGRRRATELCLDGVASRIECPMFVIAGGLDRLCPPKTPGGWPATRGVRRNSSSSRTAITSPIIAPTSIAPAPPTGWRRSLAPNRKAPCTPLSHGVAGKRGVELLAAALAEHCGTLRESIDGRVVGRASAGRRAVASAQFSIAFEGRRPAGNPVEWADARAQILTQALVFVRHDNPSRPSR